MEKKAFGFSTGALGRGDVKKALRVASGHATEAVEYSALRADELEPLVNLLLKQGAGDFRYVAVHAPSHFEPADEPRVVELLKSLLDNVAVQNIVIHPDAIHDHGLWQQFGERLCVENMDHRKPVGRTADELAVIFGKLPKARLCFDIGHAHEIDRSMSLGYEILRRFRDRIAHVHASEVSDDCQHGPFTASSYAAFAKITNMIPESAPVILETDVPENRVENQLKEARGLFGHSDSKRANCKQPRGGDRIQRSLR